jgi:hypothetical protein
MPAAVQQPFLLVVEQNCDIFDRQNLFTSASHRISLAPDMSAPVACLIFELMSPARSELPPSSQKLAFTLKLLFCT